MPGYRLRLQATSDSADGWPVTVVHCNIMHTMTTSCLTRCPVCSYDLRGLPVSHRCPECGFPYDKKTASWRPGTPWKGYGAVLAVSVAGVVGLSLSLARRWSRGESPDVSDVLILAVAAMCTVYSALHIRSSNQKGRCVVVSPTGVFLRSADIESLIAWNEIVAVERVNRRVKEERNEYIAAIKRRSSLRTVEVDKIFSSEAERTSFIEAVEANLQDPSTWQDAWQQSTNRAS